MQLLSREAELELLEKVGDHLAKRMGTGKATVIQLGLDFLGLRY